MCLMRIDKERSKWRVGYKVFTKQPSEAIESEFGDGKVLPINKWINEKDYRPRDTLRMCSINGKYDLGWHVFKELKEAKMWAWREHRAIKKVICRERIVDGVCRTGNGTKYKVSVFKEILIYNKEVI